MEFTPEELLQIRMPNKGKRNSITVKFKELE